MKYPKYMFLASLFLAGSGLYFVQTTDPFVGYIKDVMFTIGMGSLLALLIEMLSGGKLMSVLLEAFNPTFVEHRSGNSASRRFKRSFKKAKEIQYLGLTFSYPRKNFNQKDFENKLTSGCRIKIIISSKNSPFLEARTRDNTVSKIETLKSDIDNTIQYFDKLKADLNSNNIKISGVLHLRVHEELPYRGFSCFDDHCFVTPYLSDDDAAHGPLLEITKASSLLFKGYKHQFDAFWDRAKPVVEIDQFQHS